MSITTVTKTDIQERLDTLRESFGDFPVDRETSTDPPERFEETVERSREGWRGDAGLLATDPENRYLLIRHKGAPDVWGVPGGGHEPGETMCETARREFREESGLECTIDGVIRARVRRIEHETDPDRAVYMLTVWFHGETPGGDTSVDDEEVLELARFDDPPDNTMDVVADHVREGR